MLAPFNSRTMARSRTGYADGGASPELAALRIRPDMRNALLILRSGRGIPVGAGTAQILGEMVFAEVEARAGRAAAGMEGRVVIWSWPVARSISGTADSEDCEAKRKLRCLPPKAVSAPKNQPGDHAMGSEAVRGRCRVVKKRRRGHRMPELSIRILGANQEQHERRHVYFPVAKTRFFVSGLW